MKQGGILFKKTKKGDTSDTLWDTVNSELSILVQFLMIYLSFILRTSIFFSSYINECFVLYISFTYKIYYRKHSQNLIV